MSTHNPIAYRLSHPYRRGNVIEHLATGAIGRVLKCRYVAVVKVLGSGRIESWRIWDTELVTREVVA